MKVDFKETVILLMQHPIMSTPIDQLSGAQVDEAYELVSVLMDQSVDDEYTRLDYVQYARLEFLLAELDIHQGGDWESIISHYHNAFMHLQRGGFDLGIKKWVELASIRTVDIDSITEKKKSIEASVPYIY